MIFRKISERTSFIIKYTLRAILSLAVIFGLIFLFKELYFDHDPEYWIEMFYGNSLAIHLIYVGSEIIFGIFPPELFMFWAIKAGGPMSYFLNMIFFTAVSLGAGHLAYWGGIYLAKVFGKRIEKQKFIARHLPVVKKFGGLLIILAALTPLPWATISLIMGTIGYNYRKFSYFSLFRVLRFVLNGFLIYHTGSLLF